MDVFRTNTLFLPKKHEKQMRFFPKKMFTVLIFLTFYDVLGRTYIHFCQIGRLRFVRTVGNAFVFIKYGIFVSTEGKWEQRIGSLT